MIIRILFADRHIEDYKGVWRVSNICSTFENDRLMLRFYHRVDDKLIPLRDIVCWEVTDAR